MDQSSLRASKLEVIVLLTLLVPRSRPHTTDGGLILINNNNANNADRNVNPATDQSSLRVLQNSK